MSSCYNCTIAHLKKWPTGCQQGVNKVSARCQQAVIISRWKNMQVILSVFVCRQKIIFVFVFAFVIFLEGGTRSKKKIFWKMGEGGEPKYGFLIIEQSLRPITLWGSVINQNWSIIKGWQGVQRASSPNNFPLWVTRRYCPRDMTCKRCFMTRLGSFAQTLWARTFIGWKNWVTF